MQWWQDYWAKLGLIRLQSADGTADYMENLRTIFFYVQGSAERGTFPTGQAGTQPMFSFGRDTQDWGGGHYWFWNMRMHLEANRGAGNTDANLPRFRLYRDNLESIRSWTQQRMGGRAGICVPETMRFDGTGWYTGTDDGNPSCYQGGPPEWNRRNLTTASQVSLQVWRHYLATDDRAFLEHNYPLLADAARFLLAYAVEGPDGKLHTSPSNAHETQWDVSDPITDRLAMRTLFPTVIEAATLLDRDAALVTQLQAAIPKLLDLPRETRSGQTVFAYSADPLAQLRNVENLDLEPIFPWNVVSDQTPAEFELAKASYATRRFVNANDWSLDPVDAARLHNGAEVAARLRATTNSYQLYSNGLAHIGTSGQLSKPYDEHSGVTALAINEALATDFDGIVRIAPAVPPGWNAEGTVFLQHRSKVHVQVQDGAITTAAFVNGPTARDVRVKNPWPEAQVVNGANPAQVVVATTSAATLTIPAAANGTYLIQRPTAPTDALPKTPLSGAPNTAVRHLAGSTRKIGIDPPDYEPPTPCPIPQQTPLFAWDATSGDTHRRRVELRPRRPLGRRRGRLPRHGPDRHERRHQRPALPAHGEHHARLPARGHVGRRHQDQRGQQLPPDLGLEDAERRRRRRLPDRPHAERPGAHHHLRPRRHDRRGAADRPLHQPRDHRRPRRRPQRLRRRRARSAAAACPTSASTAAHRPSCASAPTRAAASASAPSSTARRCSPRC